MIDQYKHSVALACHLMLWGNMRGQMVYVDIAPEPAWADYFVRIFCGPGPGAEGATVRIVLSAQVPWQRLHYRERHAGFGSPRAREIEEWLADGMPFRWLRERCLESEIHLRKRVRAHAGSRFGRLSWLFASGFEATRYLPGRDWYIHSTWHSGWNSYYIMFRQPGDKAERFGVSEEGHMYLGDHDDMLPDRPFDWHRLMHMVPRPDRAGPLLAATLVEHLGLR